MSVGTGLGVECAERLRAEEPELLRSAVGGLAEALMAAEADAICGAALGERSATRVDRRNGYRAQEWATSIGVIEVSVPRLRKGRYEPAWLERPDADRLLVEEIAAAGENGASVPRVERLVTALGIERVPEGRADELAERFEAASRTLGERSPEPEPEPVADEAVEETEPPMWKPEHDGRTELIGSSGRGAGWIALPYLVAAGGCAAWLLAVRTITWTQLLVALLVCALFLCAGLARWFWLVRTFGSARITTDGVRVIADRGAHRRSADWTRIAEIQLITRRRRAHRRAPRHAVIIRCDGDDIWSRERVPIMLLRSETLAVSGERLRAACASHGVRFSHLTSG